MFPGPWMPPSHSTVSTMLSVWVTEALLSNIKLVNESEQTRACLLWCEFVIICRSKFMHRPNDNDMGDKLTALLRLVLSGSMLQQWSPVIREWKARQIQDVMRRRRRQRCSFSLALLLQHPSSSSSSWVWVNHHKLHAGQLWRLRRPLGHYARLTTRVTWH